MYLLCIFEARVCLRCVSSKVTNAGRQVISYKSHKSLSSSSPSSPSSSPSSSSSSPSSPSSPPPNSEATSYYAVAIGHIIEHATQMCTHQPPAQLFAVSCHGNIEYIRAVRTALDLYGHFMLSAIDMRIVHGRHVSRPPPSSVRVGFHIHFVSQLDAFTPACFELLEPTGGAFRDLVCKVGWGGGE